MPQPKVHRVNVNDYCTARYTKKDRPFRAIAKGWLLVIGSTDHSSVEIVGSVGTAGVAAGRNSCVLLARITTSYWSSRSRPGFNAGIPSDIPSCEVLWSAISCVVRWLRQSSYLVVGMCSMLAEWHKVSSSRLASAHVPADPGLA